MWSMEYSVVMSGFGGQGILMMGEMLAYCGMKAGLNVTWMPSYGAEMRGGTANCTVILSEDRIGAPVVGQSAAVIAMSEPALQKFGSLVQEGGLLVVNSSLVEDDHPVEGQKARFISVPARELAARIGDEKMANMIMLGAFMVGSEVIPFTQATRQVPSFLPLPRRQLAPMIEKALYSGREYVLALEKRD